MLKFVTMALDLQRHLPLESVVSVISNGFGIDVGLLLPFVYWLWSREPKREEPTRPAMTIEWV